MKAGFSDIVIVCPSQQSKIGEILKSKGIPISVVPDPPMAEILVANMVSPLLMVELTDDMEASENIAEILGNSKVLGELPVVVLGDQGQKKEDQAHTEKLFNKYDVLGSSSESLENQLSKALNKSFADYYNPSELPEKKSNSPANKSHADTLNVKATPGRKSSGDYGSIPASLDIGWLSGASDFIKGQFDQAHIYKGCLNGNKYIQVQNPDKLIDSEHLPQGNQYQHILQRVQEESSRWELAHFHRTAFVTFNILKSVGLGDKDMELAKACSMFFNFPNGIGRESISKATYLRPAQNETRSRIAETLQANAESFKAQDELMHMAPVMTAFSHLIAGQSTGNSNSTLNKIASALVLADAMDRECWQGGNWDARGGHTVMRWIESSEDLGIDPSIAYQTIRFLVETFQATPPEQMISNKRWFKIVKPGPSQFKSPNLSPEQLPLAEMTPGMKLATPLTTADGRLLVESNTVLDPDLIWRLWRLSAICPIQAPVIQDNLWASTSTAHEA